MPAGIFRDDSLWMPPPRCFDFDFFVVSRRHYFAWHVIEITNPSSQRLDCRCAPESLGITELRTIAILMLDDLTPQVNLAVDVLESRIVVSYFTQESRLLLVGIDATHTSQVWCLLLAVLFTARFNLFTRHVDRVVAKIGQEV